MNAEIYVFSGTCSGDGLVLAISTIARFDLTCIRTLKLWRQIECSENFPIPTKNQSSPSSCNVEVNRVFLSGIGNSKDTLFWSHLWRKPCSPQLCLEASNNFSNVFLPETETHSKLNRLLSASDVVCLQPYNRQGWTLRQQSSTYLLAQFSIRRWRWSIADPVGIEDIQMAVSLAVFKQRFHWPTVCFLRTCRAPGEPAEKEEACTGLLTLHHWPDCMTSKGHLQRLISIDCFPEPAHALRNTSCSVHIQTSPGGLHTSGGYSCCQQHKPYSKELRWSALQPDRFFPTS